MLELDKLCMLRLLPATSTTCIAGFTSGFGSNPRDVWIYPLLLGRWLGEKIEWMRKWRNYVVRHNSHGSQLYRPKQACNKLKCYELTILNEKQSISLHTFLVQYLHPQHTQRRRCNKLKCYELTILNEKQSISLHTFLVQYLHPQHTQRRRWKGVASGLLSQPRGSSSTW
jgi:hypothetical protein